MIGFMFKHRRLSLMISWPYLLYGFGLVIPVILGGRPELAFASGLYNENNLILASIVSTATIFVFLLCDFVILGKRNLSPILSRTRGTGVLPIAQLVNNWLFGTIVAFDMAVFGVMYWLAWRAGEIGREYTFLGIENNRYTGPLSTALEFLIALALLYVYALASYGPVVRRRRRFEVMFLGCLVARAIPGGRFGFVKTTILCLMLVFLILRPRLKQIVVGVLVVVSIYGAATYIGFSRSGQERSGDWFDYAFFLTAEAYFGALPLMMATDNLTNPRYQSGLPIAVAIYMTPRFVGNKIAWSRKFYDRGVFAPDGDADSLAPVGGMPFLADSMIAYGPMFILPVIVLSALLFALFRLSNSSWRALVMLTIMSGSHQLWRESYFNGVKTFIEPCILQYLLIWVVTFTGLVVPSSQVARLLAWRGKYR
jgi:hypothetical protein